jgi:predicted nucleotidyltransferase
VDFAGMASLLQEELPKVSFALVLGSGAAGLIKPHSDLDIAVYWASPMSGQEWLGLICAVEDMHQDVRCDLGILNNAEPVYRFEALKGRLVFVRDQSEWQRFFSLTCRLYELQMFHYRRQLRYRLARMGLAVTC